MDTGHWNFHIEFDIEQWHGFIYRISNTITGQQYIGKKAFHSVTRRKVKGKKNRKVIKKESKWREYTGSSTHLNADIEKYGKENFLFEIESLHQTKASLYYAEVEKQVKENVLREKIKDGINKYYNRQIGSVKFMPPEETLLESQHKKMPLR